MPSFTGIGSMKTREILATLPVAHLVFSSSNGTSRISFVFWISI